MQNGVVTVGGLVVDPVDKDSALGIVKNTPGVRDVVDHLQVAPVSPMDNRIRAAEYRSIYGSPQFTKYAINPAKPIRIIVVNGHVTLTGVVDNTGDRDRPASVRTPFLVSSPCKTTCTLPARTNANLSHAPVGPQRAALIAFRVAWLQQ